MYKFDKPKKTQADLRASHPSFRRTMGNEPLPQQPVVHVEFSEYETPTHVMGMTNHNYNTHDGEYGDDMMMVPPSQRFVAGEQFYNYEMYGSLRKGNPVSFFSWNSIGLMAAVFTSALSYQCLQSTTRPYTQYQLNLSNAQSSAVQRLVELPMSLSFFIGLLMDGYPIMGLRRKGYMVVGLVLNTVSVITLGGLSMYFESTGRRESWLVVLYIVMIAFASFGCIITYLCVHTRVIELSQREPLRRRGAMVADYLIFRKLTSFVGAGYAFFIFGWSGVAGKKGSSRVEFSTAMFIQAFLCTMPLPIILRYWKEEHYNLSTTLQVRTQIFWKIMQQKAVWRVLMFIVFFVFFLTIKIRDSTNIIIAWAHANSDNSQALRCLNDGIGLFTILIWRLFFMNTVWARFYCWAPILQAVPNVIVNILVTQGISRDRYVYRAVTSIPGIADAIQTLNPVVPLIEIIQEGSEGATVGLTLSLYRIVNIFVNTNSNGLFRGDNFYNSTKARTYPFEQDAVMWSTIIVYSINLLALGGLFFLPSQKLDAQQLRMYGGFTKSASSAIAIFALSFFLYSVAINVMTFVPSLACYPLMGGTGCPVSKSSNKLL